MSRRHQPRDHHHDVTITPNWRLRFFILFVAVTVFGLGVASPYALMSLAIDGLSAGFVLLPPMLAGLWIMRFAQLEHMPIRWHILLGVSFGLGGLSLAVLLGGTCGLLHRPIWLVIYIALITAGIIRARYLWYASRAEKNISPDTYANFIGALLLLTCPFAIMSLLAAVNAPGLIWQEEGFGYDVLEYHLQLPREYLAEGVISYRPHNVYANFPANVEMLYLSAMILLGKDIDVGVTANLIHAALIWLTVFAAWVIGKDWSPRAGAVAAVAIGTCGWVPYLSGLAYTEGGLLLFGMVATGLTLLALRSNGQDLQPATNQWRLWAMAGAMAGLACGCKYTAGPMIALPLCLIAFAAPSTSLVCRLKFACLFSLATMATLSPWLIKNTIYTGNPVFPLVNQTFKAQPPGWSETEDQKWIAGHQPPSNERSASARLATLWSRIVTDEKQRFGPIVMILAVAGLALRRVRREDAVLLFLLAVQLAVWLFATHLYARFAVVLLIPLTILTGSILKETKSISIRAGVFTMLTVGCLWNGYFSGKLIANEGPNGAPPSIFYDGQLPGYQYLATINHELPASAKILMVGDAKAYYIRRDVDYCVVFNQSEFVVAIRTKTDQAIVDWLRENSYTHILVNWSEITRLKNSYGFAEEMTPALFDRLLPHGLRVYQEFDHPANAGRYITLYEVEPASNDR